MTPTQDQVEAAIEPIRSLLSEVDPGTEMVMPTDAARTILAELTRLRAEIAEMREARSATIAAASAIAEDRDRLRAVVDRLPKTADGVAVVPGMTLWQRPGLISGKKYPPREIDWFVLIGGEDGLLGEVEEYSWTYRSSDCYSTRSAAEAAAQEAKP